MKTITGVVVSLKNEATAIVEVTTKWQHPLYKKYVSRSKKFACHLEGLELSEGDTVSISPCRPMSKTKHYKVVEKIEENK